MPAKRWPIDRFAEVGQKLIEQFDIWPIVFGGVEDADDAEFLLRAWGRGHNAAGQLSLRGSAAGLKHCRLYVGNDTGTMHLAASVGTPCIAIFSARDFPGRWYPYGDGHQVLRASIDCEGCGLVECLDRKNECLNRITVPAVLAACESILAERRSCPKIVAAEVTRL
jgi:ADP-heptose:LPS heptosyltransferase